MVIMWGERYAYQPYYGKAFHKGIICIKYHIVTLSLHNRCRFCLNKAGVQKKWDEEVK